MPFGGGAGKLQRFGRLPVNFAVAAFGNAVHATHQPYSTWTLRLQVTVIL